MSVPILGYVAIFVTILPFLAALFRIQYLDAEQRLLLLMFAVGVLNMALQIIIPYLGYYNLFLAHFYLPFEFLFFLWIFSRWFGTSPQFVLRLISVLFVLFWIVSHLTLERFVEPAQYTSLVSKILALGVTIFFLHRISADSKESILEDSRFWFLSGLLVYSSGGILFSALRNVIDKLPPEGIDFAFSAHWIISIVSNALYVIGFLCKPRNSGGQLELAR